jgi:hypothetical protein
MAKATKRLWPVHGGDAGEVGYGSKGFHRFTALNVLPRGGSGSTVPYLADHCKLGSGDFLHRAGRVVSVVCPAPWLICLPARSAGRSWKSTPAVACACLSDQLLVAGLTGAI